MTVDTQVVVVGAGPVGLLLAGELRLGGADVVVLERLARPATESRASTVHARTMEILDQRGLLEALGTPPREVAGHFGGIRLDLSGLPSPYPGIWKVLQADLERLLAEWAGGLGAEIRRGSELAGLTQHDDHVEVELTGGVRLRASFVVGCDGERSTVRAAAGLGFDGHPADKEMLRADVAGIDVPNRRFERFPGGLAVAARRPDGVTRVMAHRFGAVGRRRAGPPSFAEVAELWAELTGEDISAGTPLWVNAFDNTSRQATRYRDRRVLLAGDAAHAQMPVGGQALNLGLQDAANLGWKLAAEVRGDAPDGLLDTYQRERLPVGARVLANIRAQAELLLGPAQAGPVRAVLAELIRFDPVRRHLAAMISGLDIRYDTAGGDHPLIGARVPPVRLHTDAGPATVAELLRPARGLLIDLGHGGHDGAGARVRVVAAAPPAGDLAGVKALLVRPDGHVVWTAPGGGDLRDELCRWFGEERHHG